MPPLPPDLGLAKDEADGDSDAGDGEVNGAPRKKSRRRRGKKQKKGAVTIVEPVGLALYGEGEGVGDKELEGLKLSEADVKEDASDEVEDLKPVGPSVIGGLAVSETILGEFDRPRP